MNTQPETSHPMSYLPKLLPEGCSVTLPDVCTICPPSAPCQHCGGEVVFGIPDSGGYRRFLHVVNHSDSCPEPAHV
jgi:hypothetical protein